MATIAPLSSNNTDYFELDANKHYVSYEKNPQYIGFPTNNLFPTKYTPHIKFAFAAIKSITNAPKCYRILYNGKSIITYPTYNWLIESGATVEIDYVLLTDKFQDVSIVDFSNNQLHDDPNKDTKMKLFRNQLIGRTITGGMKEEKTVNLSFTNYIEKEQMIHECQKYGF